MEWSLNRSKELPRRIAESSIWILLVLYLLAFTSACLSQPAINILADGDCGIAFKSALIAKPEGGECTADGQNAVFNLVLPQGELLQVATQFVQDQLFATTVNGVSGGQCNHLADSSWQCGYAGSTESEVYSYTITKTDIPENVATQGSETDLQLQPAETNGSFTLTRGAEAYSIDGVTGRHRSVLQGLLAGPYCKPDGTLEVAGGWQEVPTDLPIRPFEDLQIDDGQIKWMREWPEDSGIFVLGGDGAIIKLEMDTPFVILGEEFSGAIIGQICGKSSAETKVYFNIVSHKEAIEIVK